MDTKSPTSKKLNLEDLSVGQTFRSETFTITTERIKDFALQYDPQPFHLDEEAAKDSFFKTLVASGWQTAAISMRLIVLSTPLDGGLIGASSDISWTAPTLPGDTLHVESEVLDIKTSPSRPNGIVTMRSITKNQHDKAVQTMTARLVVAKRTTT
jgi:acyl dehydratase